MLHPVDDTGFSVGRGMVCVRGEDDEEAEEGEGADFTTIKTKKQQKAQRQEERRKLEEESRREIRREATRQRKLRAKQLKAEAAAAERGETVEANEEGGEDKAEAATADEAPKRAAISLSALRRDRDTAKDRRDPKADEVTP